jgi:iron complex transport system substrate-binding protein
MISQRAFLLAVLIAPACSPAVLHAQITLTDDLHRSVHLGGPAQRIVSLAPSITECLFAIGAGDQVVAVTDYCNYPPEARRKPRVGGMVNPSMEAVIAQRPDLIVLSMEGNIREDFRRLTSLGVQVYVTNPRTMEGIHRSITQLGVLTGRADNAAQVVEAMQAREEAVRLRTSRLTPVRTLLLVSLQPLICAGSNTFINELLERAGAANLAARARGNYPTYSRETVIANNPDVIILMSDLLSDPATVTRFFPEWTIVSAIRHKQVYRIDADVVSRPGPRSVDALDALFHLLHAHP